MFFGEELGDLGKVRQPESITWEKNIVGKLTTFYYTIHRLLQFMEIYILSKNENLTFRIFETKFSMLDIRQFFFFFHYDHKTS